jgi:hypothetical protein
MNKEFVTAAILSRLAEVLTTHGFKLKGEELVREAEGIRQAVGFALADFEPVFEVSFLFGLRVHASETILNKFSGGGVNSTTCSFRLFDIAPEVGERVEIRGKPMLKSALSRLVPVVERVALPLLNTLQNTSSVERLFNSLEPTVRFLRCEPYFSWSAVILAHLARNPERDQLIEKYRARVVRQGKDCEEIYDRLVKYLKDRPLGET